MAPAGVSAAWPRTRQGLGRVWPAEDFVSSTLLGPRCQVGRRFPGWLKPVNKVAGKALSARCYADAAHGVFTSPSRVRFKEQEYAIPAESLAAALGEIRAVFGR